MSRQIEKLAREILAATPGSSGVGGDTYVTETAFSAHTGDAAAHHNWPLLDGDIPASIVRTSRQVIAGSGLTGGGDLSTNPTLNIGAGSGITVNENDVALTTPGALSHTSVNNPVGNHTHAITASSNPGASSALLKTDAAGKLALNKLATANVSSHLVPELTDTYDLGSATKLWRKGWLSELESVLFVENSISVMGGYFMIPHASGTLPGDVSNVATQIDFGQAMTAGDFVLMRGNLAVEYIQVGFVVSGTVYSAIRNVDGSGANSWPAGQVFAVLGNAGDGRIEFDAQTGGPRISVFEQGAAYNAQDERVRIGDMSGWGAYSDYGIGIGDPSGDRLAYTPGDGLEIVIGGGGVALDDEGITINKPAYNVSPWSESFKFKRPNGDVVGGLQAYTDANLNKLDLRSMFTNGGFGSSIQLTQYDTGGGQVDISASGTGSRINLIASSYVSLTGEQIIYTGQLVQNAGGGPYTMYAFHPLTSPATSTAWDGDAKTNGNQTIDLSAVFGLPAAIKGILVRLTVRDETVDSWGALGPSAGAYTIISRVLVTNQYNDSTGIVPCNGTGDVIFTANGDLNNVVIQIYGYLI